MTHMNEVCFYGNKNTVQNAFAHETSKTFSYNGNDVLFDTKDDVMVNATQLAKIYGKRPAEYLRLPDTIKLINAITRKYGISENQLVVTSKGGNISDMGKSHIVDNQQGTWMHRLIVVDFCQWLDIDLKLWCTEKLDELMRYGMTATQPTLEQMIDNPDLVIHLATQLKKEREEKEKLRIENESQQHKIAIDAPKVEFYDEVVDSKDALPMDRVAKLLNIGIGRNRLFAFLREKKVLMPNNTPYQKYVELGWFRCVESKFSKPNGDTCINIKTVVLQKGLDGIRKMFNNKK